jgi:hypothetical protein
MQNISFLRNINICGLSGLLYFSTSAHKWNDFRAKNILNRKYVLFYLKFVSPTFLILNRLLRRVFGPERDEMTGKWRKLHNEELNDLYSLPNIVRVVKLRRMRWAGHVARMGKDRGVHRVLVEKPEGKSPLGRPRRRWEDNIKMDFQ